MVGDQLKKIRDKKSKTRKYNDDIEFSRLATTLGVSEDSLEKLSWNEEFWERVNEILIKIPSGKLELNDEERTRESQELDEMIHYVMQLTGYSGGFHERRRRFGTIIVNKSLPPTADIFLKEIKNFFLLNQFEAVIGFSRILLEIACQYFFDQIPESVKANLRNIDGEFGARQKIREACRYRLKSLGQNQTYIEKIKNLAESKYSEASDILHGKLPRKTEEETLDFLKDIFSVIEVLYSSR